MHECVRVLVRVCTCVWHLMCAPDLCVRCGSVRVRVRLCVYVCSRVFVRARSCVGRGAGALLVRLR